ncbi:MAG: DUF222 domain-containing protein, partial [Acidobacteria bacterium]|nr:DUF222 domain-containing protein [Acidobacteriota bacterium]
TVRMTPEQAGIVIATIDTGVMANNTPDASNEPEYTPSLSQQRCDVFVDTFKRAACTRSTDTDGVSPNVEVVIHAHHAPDGRIVGTLADGTPLSGAAVEELACSATIRALMHHSNGRPIDATPARRGPTKRQIRLLTERDHHCTYGRCKSTDFLHAHHIIHRTHDGPTTLDNLTLLCGHHHRHIHNHQPEWQPAWFTLNEGSPRTAAPAAAAAAATRRRGSRRHGA